MRGSLLKLVRVQAKQSDQTLSAWLVQRIREYFQSVEKGMR